MQNLVGINQTCNLRQLGEGSPEIGIPSSRISRPTLGASHSLIELAYQVNEDGLLRSRAIASRRRTSAQQITRGIHVSMPLRSAPAAAECCLPGAVELISVPAGGILLRGIRRVHLSGADPEAIFEISQLAGHFGFAELAQNAVQAPG